MSAGSSQTSFTGTSYVPGATGYAGSTPVHVGSSTAHHHFHSHSQTQLAQTLDLWLEQPPNRSRFQLGVFALFFTVLALVGTDSMTSMLMFLCLLWIAVPTLVVRRYGPRFGMLAGLATFGATALLVTEPGRLDAVYQGTVVVGPIVAVLALGSWAWAWIGYRRRAPLREHLYEVWSRLFYCSRDGRVFDPATGMHTDPHDVNALLHAR
ncbi:hypothetical protein [Nocardiopsis halotolerans]|uniref:hypothetical protein n=1 Tax=Nocardiopsis halotolerans TaxID=124252 RepID=UPI0012681F5E|nr:hypothetical protein [Nocardiopsis halotolerans]